MRSQELATRIHQVTLAKHTLRKEALQGATKIRVARSYCIGGLTIQLSFSHLKAITEQ